MNNRNIIFSVIALLILSSAVVYILIARMQQSPAGSVNQIFSQETSPALEGPQNNASGNGSYSSTPSGETVTYPTQNFTYNSIVPNIDSSWEFAPWVPIEYARRFSLEFRGDYILATDGQGRKIALVKRGVAQPAGDFDLVIEVPVRRVVHLSEVAWYLWALNSTDVLVGVSSSTWYLEEIKNRLANGSIVEVGSARSPDYEKICQLQPDLVFISVEFSGVGVAEKLSSLGIKYVSIDAYVENDPLARVEWIKFVGAFINKLDKALDYFNAVRGKVIQIQQKILEKYPQKPNVCYALLYSKGISIPGDESYHRRLIEMLNAEYLFKDLQGSGYVSVSKEVFLSRVMNADIYIAIYMGTPVDKIEDLSQYVPEIVYTKPFVNGQVYAMQPWFWQYICKLDVIVEDLVSILYPELSPGHQLTMFKKVG